MEPVFITVTEAIESHLSLASAKLENAKRLRQDADDLAAKARDLNFQADALMIEVQADHSELYIHLQEILDGL